MVEKIGELLQEINNETGGALSDLLVKVNRCPGCGEGRLERKEQDLCCVNCGLVIQEGHFSNVVPFGNERTFSKNIAFDDGLGGTLGLKGTRAMAWKIHEKKPFKCPKCHYEGNYVCPVCNYEMNDYPLRANQLFLASQNFDHPKIRTIKKLGSLRAKAFGLDDRRSQNSSAFMTYFMDRAKKVAAHYIVQNARVSVQKITDVCFAFTARDLFGPTKFQEVKDKLKLNDRDVEDFGIVYEVDARK